MRSGTRSKELDALAHMPFNPHMPASVPSTNPKEAVVTIQGGGLLGVSLLGQLHAVLVEHEIVPLAFAGNSAGAIVATLVWADLLPEQILARLKELAPRP